MQYATVSKYMLGHCSGSSDSHHQPRYDSPASRQIAGNFHVAPGKSYQNHHTHIHDMQLFKKSSWDLSHQINKLSFGDDYPGLVNPLDGVSKTAGTYPISLSLSVSLFLGPHHF
jgi:hypothetical protein